jgi:hypothetical protein
MSRLAIVGALAAAIGLSACKSKEQGAKEHFSQDATCPEDRVEVRARTDLKPSMWLPKETPPASIAADPGRLAMWQDARDQRLASTDSRDDIFEARGCGQQKVYACHRHNKDLGYIMCSSFPQGYPPGVAKW